MLAVLDQPGEWGLDSRTDTLYLWPIDGQPTDDIVAPALTELIRVEGDIDYAGPEDLPVVNLVFRGLTFTHGDRFPWHGQTGWGVQHDWERFDSPSAMLRLRGSRNCAVVDCHFSTVEPDWGTAHLLKMRPFEVERHSLAADPLFVDVENADFRFQRDSPALQLGIDQPVATQEVGLPESYRTRWEPSFGRAVRSGGHSGSE